MEIDRVSGNEQGTGDFLGRQTFPYEGRHLDLPGCQLNV